MSHGTWKLIVREAILTAEITSIFPAAANVIVEHAGRPEKEKLNSDLDLCSFANQMSKKLTPFSKEHLDYPTVSSDEGQRSGFTEHVKVTHCSTPEQPKNLIGGMEWTSTSGHLSGNESYPDFKGKSDDGLPAFPAPFSKKTISGGPAKPGTPA